MRNNVLNKYLDKQQLWFALNLVSLSNEEQLSRLLESYCLVVICSQFSIFVQWGTTDCLYSIEYHVVVSCIGNAKRLFQTMNLAWRSEIHCLISRASSLMFQFLDQNRYDTSWDSLKLPCFCGLNNWWSWYGIRTMSLSLRSWQRIHQVSIQISSLASFFRKEWLTGLK